AGGDVIQIPAHLGQLALHGFNEGGFLSEGVTLRFLGACLRFGCGFCHKVVLFCFHCSVSCFRFCVIFRQHSTPRTAPSPLGVTRTCFFHCGAWVPARLVI